MHNRISRVNFDKLIGGDSNMAQFTPDVEPGVVGGLTGDEVVKISQLKMFADSLNQSEGGGSEQIL